MNPVERKTLDAKLYRARHLVPGDVRAFLAAAATYPPASEHRVMLVTLAEVFSGARWPVLDEELEIKLAELLDAVEARTRRGALSGQLVDER